MRIFSASVITAAAPAVKVFGFSITLSNQFISGFFLKRVEMSIVFENGITTDFFPGGSAFGFLINTNEYNYSTPSAITSATAWYPSFNTLYASEFNGVFFTKNIIAVSGYFAPPVGIAAWAAGWRAQIVTNFVINATDDYC